MLIKVALLQINPFRNNLDLNMQKGLEYCDKAKLLGADIVLFPEMWSIGYELSNQDRKTDINKFAITIENDWIVKFKNKAKELNINIGLTFLQKNPSGEKPLNSIIIINSNGDIVLNYSKVFLCNFGVEELNNENPDPDKLGCDLGCEAGNDFPVCEIVINNNSITVGCMICADREFPEAGIQLYKNGAEIILIPNCCEMDPARKAMLKTRAFETFSGIALANYPEPKNFGHSIAYDCIIWNENGEYKESLKAEGSNLEEIVLVEFDMNKIRKFRESEQWRKNYKLNFGI